jgi:hypothetical protein
MKIQKISQWFSLLLFVTVITGCTQSTESTITSSPTTPVLFVSASPTETMPPILTPTVTGTSTPAFTPTAVPTLPAEDARKRLLELLATNGDCRLPCLWGITPGKSTNQEARDILMPLSSIAIPEMTSFEPLNGILGGTITSLYVEDELRLNARTGFDVYGNGDIVNSVDFRVLEESLDKKDEYGNQIKTPIYDSPTFGKRVEYYSLAHVLSEQGIPDSVRIYIPRVEGYPIVAGILEAALLYPEQGIWIKYAMSMYNNGNIIKGCPANAHIEMQLYPSGNPESFFSILEKTGWGRTKGGYKPLEEATSMSVEQFYEIFRNPTDKCIETPTNLWPTPEP